MKIHLIEHDPLDFKTNIDSWAAQGDHGLSRTEVFRGDPFPDLPDYDWLMVMGGSQHAWEETLHPWLVSEKKEIARALAAGKTILGICFGAQLLAEVLGGQVFTHRQKEIGWYPVHKTPDGESSPLLHDLPDRFLTFHWHSDHFRLPKDAVRLAASDCSENQIFSHPAYPILGLQFHPEYTREMIGHFARDFGAEWTPGPFVAGLDRTLAQTQTVPDTYWLMETILNNMENAWSPTH